MNKKFNCQSYGVTDRGTVRSRNEDSILLLDEYGLWMVADGAGGHTDGHLASQAAVTALNTYKPSGRLGSDARQAIRLLRNANAQLMEKRERTGGISGSTATIVLTDGANAVCIWTGDSPLFRLREGLLTQLNQEHNRVEEFLRQGFTLEECGRIPYAQQLIQALGAAEFLGVQTRLLDMKINDIIIICSDGLTKAVSNESICHILNNTINTPNEAAPILLATALANGAKDNVSVISIYVLPN